MNFFVFNFAHGCEGRECVWELRMYAHPFTHIRTHARARTHPHTHTHTRTTQVRLKIKHMEIEIRKRESTGSGSDLYNESETITKFEIMDGMCVGCLCVVCA